MIIRCSLIRILFTFYLLCIGKVHGSLARAGKVKGQTPKVRKPFKVFKSMLNMIYRLTHKRRRKRRQAELRDGCSTTGDL